MQRILVYNGSANAAFKPKGAVPLSFHIKLYQEHIHMIFFQQLAQNKLFFTAAAGWLAAQILKTIIHTILLKEFSAERLVGSGGMPSSHSATVCA